jgi:ZIP family zinc transporter
MNETGSVVFGLSFLFLTTSAGAALVFLFRKGMNASVKAAVFGFASGVMIAASFWGLLTPAIHESKIQGLSYPFWIPTVVGFVVGCLLLLGIDLFSVLMAKRAKAHSDERLDNGESEAEVELEVEAEVDVEAEREREIRLRNAHKLFLAVLIHNIPEGCACGLVFGHALKQEGEEKTKAIAAAVSLSIGIGIQDFPEGAAVAIPIKEISGSALRGFIYGVLSGAVEPAAGGLALLISQAWRKIDPWALAFSAGAMLYVTIEELVPESLGGGYPKVSMWMFVLGFVVVTIGEHAL